MKIKSRLLFAESVALVLALPTMAQSAVDSTCSTPPPSINSFYIEHVEDLTKLLSTLTPNIPASITGPIFSGQQEVHSRILYDDKTKLVTNDLFLVPPGSPVPTPTSFNITQNRFAYVIAKIDKVYLSCLPRPSVWMSGVTIDGFPVFGNPTGSTYGVGFGYTTDNPPQIRDLVSLAVGIGDEYSASSYGTLVFGTVGAVVAGGPLITTTTPTVVLDGSGSTGGPLTYTWSSPSYGVAFTSQGSASTPVLIDAGPGDYMVDLTVTNAALNQTSVTRVTIRYKPL